MEKNEFITSMIETGKCQLKEQEEAEKKEHYEKVQNNRRLWDKLLIEARSYFISDIRDAVRLFPSMNIDFDKPPVASWKDASFYLEIDGCAPILLKFVNKDDRLECKYVIPKVVDDPELYYEEFTIAGRYGWSWRSGYGWILLGKNMFDSLSLALASAAREYELAQELIAEETAQEPEQPEYQDLDGTEPLPDQVLINGVRQLIREEIQKLRA